MTRAHKMYPLFAAEVKPIHCENEGFTSNHFFCKHMSYFREFFCAITLISEEEKLIGTLDHIKRSFGRSKDFFALFTAHASPLVEEEKLLIEKLIIDVVWDQVSAMSCIENMSLYAIPASNQHWEIDFQIRFVCFFLHHP